MRLPWGPLVVDPRRRPITYRSKNPRTTYKFLSGWQSFLVVGEPVNQPYRHTAPRLSLERSSIGLTSAAQTTFGPTTNSLLFRDRRT